MRITETQRLFLRALTLDDVDALAEASADQEVYRFVRGAHTREQTQGDIEYFLGIQQEHGFSLWAVVDKATGHLLGLCGFTPEMVEGAAEIEITYLIARPHRQQGLATEAAQAALTYASQALGFARVIAPIAHENLAGQRVAEKCGLRYDRDIGTGSQTCRLYVTQLA